MHAAPHLQAAEQAQVPSPTYLPNPSLLPNLRSLTVGSVQWGEAPAWVGALAQLAQWTGLHLWRLEPSGSQAEPITLPALPALQRLVVGISRGCPQLRLELGRLPALEVLEGRNQQRAGRGTGGGSGGASSLS